MAHEPGSPPSRSVWIDVSRPLDPATPVWPGDRPFLLDRRVADGVAVSSFSASCHIGTHLDAPGHIDTTAGGVETISLDRLIGSAEVIAVTAELIAPEHLPAGWRPAAPRVLLRTDSHPLGAPIGRGFAAVDARLVHWLADRGVELVGIDTPSVDPFDSDALPAHRALLERGMTWIEGLWLGGVAPGRYELVALPMAIAGADAAPVRAVLRPQAPGEPAA
jgi:arylformamidase